ncbi:uncharacterized protein PHALS_03161 [Plasmopara halstedii]|uniref:Uncharacterized protein n=1 Tax=Plasmopara halstedii TaxID=4781 RepID=A0A0P1A7J5_PLAHL|nr:uncharacterized protein PHALS_03161 [Plasmopara halstedii]CEG36616.1 hypothetical protein PHALS_03161 [Plasmopara halstedii]|eukprot:XP_024572985.1 hypothetical protein PHALS_03161 [Plasmopara halstedii]
MLAFLSGYDSGSTNISGIQSGHRGVEAVLLIACALCSRLELVSVRTQSLLSSRKGTQRQHERERLLVTMDATDASKRRLMSMR